MILDIIGGGGSGKTTLKFALLNTTSSFVGYTSYTTRVKRPEETDGVQYHFVSHESFLNNDSLTLKREADGHLYGIDQKDLLPRTDGKILVATFNVVGVRTLEKMGRDIKVLYLNIPEKERINRMLLRGDDPEQIIRRITADRTYLNNLEFDSPLLEITGGNIDEIISKIHAFVDK